MSDQQVQTTQPDQEPISLFSALLRKAWRALVRLIKFIIAMILGVITFILVALPWLLRAAAVVAWFIGGYKAIVVIEEIYKYSGETPTILLKFAAIFLMVALAGITLRWNRKYIWGGLAAGGGLAYGVSSLSLRAFNNWETADHFFGALPTALFVAGFFFIILRLKTIRETRQNRRENVSEEQAL